MRRSLARGFWNRGGGHSGGSAWLCAACCKRCATEAAEKASLEMAVLRIRFQDFGELGPGLVKFIQAEVRPSQLVAGLHGVGIRAHDPAQSLDNAWLVSEVSFGLRQIVVGQKKRGPMLKGALQVGKA